MKDSLDVLLEEALAHASKYKIKKLPGKIDAIEKSQQEFNRLFGNPENWQRTRGIALIHKAKDGSITLLGNFSEYLFNKKVGVRKLLREATPIEVSCEEYVTGDWWLTYKQEQFEAQVAERVELDVCLDLELPELMVYAKEVIVKATVMKDRYIEKVELTNQTRFDCPTNQMFIYFPAGLNILEGLSMENKMTLKELLGV